MVKEAKASLEKALKQNPNALDGSAYTSLGSLYYKVPGWPVGFGDDEQAERLLKKHWRSTRTVSIPTISTGIFC
ncbi:hypothetical protein PCI56_27515 [Plesiomonas shigelloides subsp. oncorhynchi]|nr:hypothetical protein [Plesiomonas shigelloides]